LHLNGKGFSIYTIPKNGIHNFVNQIFEDFTVQHLRIIFVEYLFLNDLLVPRFQQIFAQSILTASDVISST
jgi:hypothetical protein